MKGLVFLFAALAIITIAPANAEKRNDGCNETDWVSLSADPCPPVRGSSYVECISIYRKLAWAGSEREWCRAAEQPRKAAQPATR